MKKIIKPHFWLSLGLVFVIALTLSHTVLGQERISIEDKTYDFNEAIDMLADNQKELIKLLRTSIFGASSLELTPESGTASVVILSGDEYDPFSTCATNYTNWPSSNAYNEDARPFQMRFIEAQGINQFTDINGDGILDYVTAYKNSTKHAACVLLGNGNGLDIAYRCIGNYDTSSHTWTFYGDCADVN